jgi:hypothetical protein
MRSTCVNTNSVGQSPSWQSDSRSAGQEITPSLMELSGFIAVFNKWQGV